MAPIKVFGHINPDTDSTATPIAYAWFLTQKGKPATAYVANEPNKEALYLLEKFGFEKPETLTFAPGDTVVIIDTNNKDELKEGFESASILEIIDHHKLFGNISTDSPVAVTMKPVACVATIVWGIMKADGMIVPGPVAGLLLGAILSDTLKFTSPTTTDEDKSAAAELAEISGVSIDELADAMFSAKSDLTGMNADDILHMDSKIFDLAGKRIRISVLETTKPENAVALMDEIKTRMNELKSEESLDMIFFYIVDIIKSQAEVVALSEEEKSLIQKAHGVAVTGDTAVLPGVVSRKKQMVPKIEEALQG